MSSLRTSLVVFLTLVVAVVDASSLQAGKCAVACPPLKQTYCALESPSATTFVSTYTSQCNCLVAKCGNKKVQCLSASPAKSCDNSCTRKIAKCKSNEVKPVCGSNGVTYDNLCFLKAARCVKPDIQFIAPGKCPKKMTTCGIAKCQLTKAKVCASMDGGKTELKYQNQCFLDAATCVNSLIKKVAACKARRVLSVAASNTTMTVDEVDSDLDEDIGSLVIPDGSLDDDDDDFLIIDDLMDPTTVVNDTVPIVKNTSAPSVSTPAPSKKASAAHVERSLAWAVLAIATVLVAAA